MRPPFTVLHVSVVSSSYSSGSGPLNSRFLEHRKLTRVNHSIHTHHRKAKFSSQQGLGGPYQRKLDHTALKGTLLVLVNIVTRPNTKLDQSFIS